MTGGTNSGQARPSEFLTYLQYILALFSPGKKVPVFDSHNVEPQSISSWSPDEKKLLIDEGRRQIDKQIADLNQTQTRAQLILTTSIALGAGWVATLPAVMHAVAAWKVFAFIFWIVSAFLIVLSTLGAASIMSARSEFGVIHTTRLTYSKPPVLDAVAAAYARTVRVGGNTVATRLTLLRISVLFLLAAAAVLGLAWLTSQPGSETTNPTAPPGNPPASPSLGSPSPAQSTIPSRSPMHPTPSGP